MLTAVNVPLGCVRERERERIIKQKLGQTQKEIFLFPSEMKSVKRESPLKTVYRFTEAKIMSEILVVGTLYELNFYT
jgi:hypothetical protein